jgi:hypothetical protein
MTCGLPQIRRVSNAKLASGQTAWLHGCRMAVDGGWLARWEDYELFLRLVREIADLIETPGNGRRRAVGVSQAELARRCNHAGGERHKGLR